MVSHLLSMREALGSIPSVSIIADMPEMQLTIYDPTAEAML